MDQYKLKVTNRLFFSIKTKIGLRSPFYHKPKKNRFVMFLNTREPGGDKVLNYTGVGLVRK